AAAQVLGELRRRAVAEPLRGHSISTIRGTLNRSASTSGAPESASSRDSDALGVSSRNTFERGMAYEVGGTSSAATSCTRAAASVELVDGRVYLAGSLRNAGAGVAILQGWHAYVTERLENREIPSVEEFRPQTRDLYVPSGDVGFWQAAIRDRDDSQYREFV